MELLELYVALQDHLGDFRNLLYVQDIYRTNPDNRYFGNFLSRTKRYMLSIQASKHHYCIPKETLDDYFMYEKFEMALIDLKTDDFISFKSIGHEDEVLSEQYEDIYPYVPVKNVLEAFKYFNNYVGERR